MPEAAARLGVKSADLADVLEGRVPMTVDIALRLETAGWDTAEGWMSWQVDRDSIQVPRRQAHEACGGEGRKDALVGAVQMGVTADKRLPQGANALVDEVP